MSELHFKYKGTMYPSKACHEEDIAFAENEFIVRDDDIFNITYPKSGTTWVMDILSLIKKNGDPTWNKTVPNWERVPWLETYGMARKLEVSEEKPRLITSHLQRRLFSKSYAASKAKVIYTIRNPKDVAVSLYYFAKMSAFFEDPGDFDQFVKAFLTEEVTYGSWFDHVNGWMEMFGKDNFMLQTYEDLQKDLRGSVIKICKFLGMVLDDKAVDSVVENVSFQSMKDNQMSNFSLVPSEYMDQEKYPFMRKGVAGDWKNHFSVALNEYFDNVYKTKMQDLKVKFPWDKNV